MQKFSTDFVDTAAPPSTHDEGLSCRIERDLIPRRLELNAMAIVLKFSDFDTSDFRRSLSTSDEFEGPLAFGPHRHPGGEQGSSHCDKVNRCHWHPAAVGEKAGELLQRRRPEKLREHHRTGCRAGKLGIDRHRARLSI